MFYASYQLRYGTYSKCLQHPSNRQYSQLVQRVKHWVNNTKTNNIIATFPRRHNRFLPPRLNAICGFVKTKEHLGGEKIKARSMS